MHFYPILRNKDEFMLKCRQNHFIFYKWTNHNIFMYLHSTFVNERQRFERDCNMQISFFLQYPMILYVTSNTDKTKVSAVYQIKTEGTDTKMDKQSILLSKFVSIGQKSGWSVCSFCSLKLEHDALRRFTDKQSLES